MPVDDNNDRPPTPNAEGIVPMLRRVVRLLADGLLDQKGRLIASSVCRLLASVSLLGPWFIQRIIDEALPQKSLPLFWQFALGLLAVHLVSYVFWAVQVYTSYAASETIFLQLRLRLVEAIMNKPRRFFSQYPPGDLLTRLVGDMDRAAMFFYDTLLRSIAYAIFVLATAVFMLVWNWRLALIALAALPLSYFYCSRINAPLGRRVGVARGKQSGQNEVLLDLLQGQGEIRFFQQQKSVVARFREAASAYTGASIRASTCGEWMWGGVDAIGLLMVLLPFLAGGYLICRGESTISIGMLVAYYSYLANLAGKAQFLFGGLAQFAQTAPSFQRLQEILEAHNEPEPAHVTLDQAPDDATLEFRKVGFQYPSGPGLLRDLDLIVRPGEKLAVMGASGSGKSTLVSLLLRFQTPTRGHIFLGGKDIEDYSPRFYYSFFGYVSQRINLFNFSVRENIALGWHQVPFDRIQDAARQVQLHEVIEALPHGYDTVLGRDGLALSGGQLQRLALARALVREPEILVLDEFTSALDRALEREILDELLSRFERQTIVCITHSPVVAARFSRVLNLPQE
ncbi:MAG: hypothetical protein A3K19_33240 [Lentisphaerae bacterium RIFOXYB12_FULL_65_16]|nr:MAG: hypothetical protein A3K18_24055 [Lentisphaerae bacterium RIFOXYA12_64_32]OGV86897.1 MAG: hypothetical protein A3K19_33240 [Lentisphaerae bacterium RIFOXYB12_FULL_65_16]